LIKKSFLVFLFTFLSCVLFAQERTEITGDRMEIKNSGIKTVVKGNAKIERKNTVVTSDKMTYYKDSSQVEATGNVKLFVINKDSSTINSSSQEAVYNTENSSGQLWGGSPCVEYKVKDSTDTLYMYADKFYLGQDSSSARAQDNVKIISSSGTIVSDNAYLDRQEKTLFMQKDENKPRIIFLQEDKTADFKADEILMLYNEKTVQLNENVEGKIIMDIPGAKQ